MTNRKTKKIIVAKARKLVAEKFPTIKGSTGACLYLTAGVIAVAQGYGIKLLLQAGSCYWPRVTPKTDDGIESNVFGYEYDAIAAAPFVAADLMPEMHVWAGDPLTNEIVDLTSGSFPAQCRKLLGVGWKAPRPPAYFWDTFENLPKLARYAPDRDASLTAAEFLRRSLEGDDS